MVKNQGSYLIYISGKLKNGTSRIFIHLIFDMRKLIFFPVLLCIHILCFSQERSPVKATDMLKIKSASNLGLSRAGSKIVYTVTSIEPDGDTRWEYKYVNQLWLASTDGSFSPKQLTTSKEGSAQGVFSPDARQIAFVRTVDGKGQIFLLSLDGGEPVQLTKFKYGAGSPKWSPDGKQMLFSCSVPLKDLLKDSLLNPGKTLPSWSLEKPGFDKNEQLLPGNAKADPDGNLDEIRAYLENNTTDKKAKLITKLNFQDEMDVNGEINFTHYYLVDITRDAVPQPVSSGFYRYTFMDFTPDGKLIFTADLNGNQHPDRSQESSIYLINKDRTGRKLLAGKAGYNYNSPRLSPSGNWLAFQYNQAGSGVNIPVLAIMNLKAAATDQIDLPFDRTKGNMIWSEDERYVYFSAGSNGGQPVYRADIKTKAVERITEESSGIIAFDLKGNKLAYIKTEVADPFELYVSDNNGRGQKKISSLNTEWLASRQLSLPEKRSFVNEQGMTVEYWVMKPTNYKAGEKYPLLLEIHGGPASMWGPGEASMWHEYQYFCSRGYGVVYSNPRGSGGYGLDFLRANINDWGKGPSSDVLTALEKTVSAEPWADTSRLLITGGSYAGYLVAWIIAHDHRFKAACSQRGVYDLATFFGEGNAWRLVPAYFGGYPWEPAVKATLERESPINYVQDITTPYIIFHGDNDRRTGFVQSEMMYRSLKVLGRPVEYVRHPGGTHELTRSGNNRQRIDQMLRTFEFFERWIKNK